MAKPPAPSAADIMPDGALRSLLKRSKIEPLSAALAMTRDKEGVVLLDKVAGPKRVVTLLKKGAKEAKVELEPASFRFGTAEVDTDVNPKLVTFKVNKEAGGQLEKMIRLRCREVGYPEVDIIVDEALEAEPDGPAASEAPAAAAPPPPPSPGMQALQRRLAGLIGRIAGVPAERQPALAALARTAGPLVKGADVAAATEAVSALETALEAGGPGGAAADVEAVRTAWIETSQKVAAEIKALRAALVATYADVPAGDGVGGAFDQRVAPLLRTLDTEVADKLAAVAQAGDEAARRAAKTAAKQRALLCAAALGEGLVGELDANPFTKVAIRATVAGTLRQVSAVCA